ncbi:MFS transporter [Amycolatopsis sp. YIM 10]|uniref:MFS transporter n=1 Tax=Amycolatopsis sp. YIM 10 TaxID=2653857 RepID=UPI0012900D28|nr:MFS transporter [Amycolatopsis sp. YIM 10]QFU88624.1 enterobactin exporter EntS [Amycolatopsis sp. YIM 10]
MLELLRDPVYIRYWLAVVVSFLGDAMTRITLIYVTAQLTGSPSMIAVVVFAQLLPQGALGAFAGPLIDRLPKRAVLVTADLTRSLVVGSMIFFTDSIWTLLALILLSGVGTAFFETARIAAVPTIVAGKSLPTAIALFQSTYQTIQLVGPAVGGLLLTFAGTGLVLAIDAATFGVSALLLGSLTVLRHVPSATGTREPYWRSLGTGIRGVLAIPSLRFVFVALIPATAVFGLFTTNFNAELLTVFDLPAAGYGFAQASLAVGSVLGALLGPMLIRRYRAPNTLLVVAIAAFGVALLLLAPTQWLWARVGIAAVLPWCLVAGLFASLYQVPAANTLLGDLPEHLRGRGVGLLNTTTYGLTLIGVAIGGVLAVGVGVAASVVIAGAALVLIAGALLLPYARVTRHTEEPV